MNAFTAKAPARANIIGEHTDYAPNGGHVLPTPLPFYTTVTAAKATGAPGRVTISSEDFDEPPCERMLTESRRGHWSDYVVGCLRVASNKVDLPALTVTIESDVPIGCGISSSAALCVAVVRAVKGLVGANWSDEQVALMAYEAEHDFVGVPCGKMDQFASSIGRPGQALLLDTKTLAYRHYPLPDDVAIMLVESGTISPKATVTQNAWSGWRNASRPAIALVSERCASSATAIWDACRRCGRPSRGAPVTSSPRTCACLSL